MHVRHRTSRVARVLALALASSCGLDPNAPESPSSSSAGSATDASGGSTPSSGQEPTTTTGGDSSAACQELEDSLSACIVSLSGSLMCDLYEDWPCDLDPYFDCVSDAYGPCVGGSFPDVDVVALQACAELTNCT